MKFLKKLKKAATALMGKAYFVGHEMSALPNKIYVYAVYASMITASTVVNAGSTNGAALFTGWRKLINSAISLLVLAAVLAGIGAILYGLTQLVKKGMGRGEDVEWRQIYWPLGGGAMLTVLMYMVEGLVGESGASGNDIGASRTFGP